MFSLPLSQWIAEITGAEIIAQHSLPGGCVSNARCVTLSSGEKLVIKSGGDADLEIEGDMLRYFAAHSPIPCPEVISARPDILVMRYVENDNRMSGSVQTDLAEKLAAQHNVTAARYGLSFDTLIGGLHQPNTQEESWVTFFGEHRLRHMARDAVRHRRMAATFMTRIDRLIAKLPDLVPDARRASLLHGDLWGGNILCRNGKLAALIDPAIYYGDPEIELAFGTLFGDLTPDFFDRYNEINAITPGFFEERRELYNLYPLLVHVRLFGGSYVGSVDRILSRFGA